MDENPYRSPARPPQPGREDRARRPGFSMLVGGSLLGGFFQGATVGAGGFAFAVGWLLAICGLAAAPSYLFEPLPDAAQIIATLVGAAIFGSVVGGITGSVLGAVAGVLVWLINASQRPGVVFAAVLFGAGYGLCGLLVALAIVPAEYAAYGQGWVVVAEALGNVAVFSLAGGLAGRMVARQAARAIRALEADPQLRGRAAVAARGSRH